MDEDQQLSRRKFLVRCQDASTLVENFLNDTLPLGLVPERRKGYIYDTQRRQRTKEKVMITMDVLGKAIDCYGYVTWLFRNHLVRNEKY